MRRLRPYGVAAVTLLCVGGMTGSASAFDSAGAELGMVTHTPPIPAAPYPFGGNYFQPLDDKGNLPSKEDPFYYWSAGEGGTLQTPGSGAHYFVDFVHHSVGGVVGDGSDDGSVANLMTCSASAFAYGKPIDLSQCQPLTATPSSTVNNLGWVKTRRSWSMKPTDPDEKEDGVGPEHMLLLQAAASLAGFDSIPLLKQKFWVRYPAENRYIASPVGQTLSDLQSDSPFVVGPSYTPVGFNSAASHVVRGIYLPELAQMPDVSSSIWDWAAGNEFCPYPNLVDPKTGISVFSGSTNHDFDVNACHDYAQTLGPLNASHFMPASEGFYKYYHRLAKDRIVECNALAKLNDTYYADAERWTASGTGYGQRFQQPGNTEGHECEREAFVYEMFAQHYLQDAWATGHMWARWGHLDIGSYPAYLGLGTFRVYDKGGVIRDFYIDSPLYPAVNTMARKHVIASITAIYAGMIHGAKAVTAQLKRQQVGWMQTAYETFSVLTRVRVLDDPLSGPEFFDLTSERSVKGYVGWRDDTVPPGSPPADDADKIFDGVGDLFVDAKSLADITKRDRYKEQRTRLLSCSASSLLEVYRLGPKLHGALGPMDSRLSEVDPASDYCWKHWATNESMLGATSPFFLRRKWKSDGSAPEDSSLIEETAVAYANLAVVAELGKASRFPDAKDGKAFIATLGGAIQEAHSNIMKSFVLNAKQNPHGTESAKLLDVSDRGAPANIAIFHVQPNTSYGDGSAPPTAPGASSPVAFVDSKNDQFMKNMFWRAHIKDWCAQSIAPLAGSPSVPGYTAPLRIDHAEPGFCYNSPTFDPITGYIVESRPDCLAESSLPSSPPSPAPNLLSSLRDRCIAAAPSGGDPETCTACVELAELHVARGAQYAGPSADPASKCAMLGVSAGTDASALPPEFFSVGGSDPKLLDDKAQVLNKYLTHRPSFWAAFSYCTGTENPRMVHAQHGDGERFIKSLGGGADSACSTDTDPRKIGDAYLSRVGLVHSEIGSADGPSVPAPYVSAVEVKFVPSEYKVGDTCVPFETSLGGGGAVIDLDAPNTPDAAHTSNFRRRLTPDEDLMFGWCGPVQRFSWWDKTCDEVAGFGPKFPPWENGKYESFTGFMARTTFLQGALPELGTRCELRESRFLMPTCASGSVCGSGGFCRGTVATPLNPEVTTFYSPPVGTPPTEVCDASLMGGPYRRLCVSSNEERHHMPAWDAYKDVIDLTRADGPCIVMTIHDHRLTASHGLLGDDSVVWRAASREKIRAGHYFQAMEDDIEDIRQLSKAGSLERDYEPAIAQMEAYAHSLNSSLIGPK